MKLINKLNYLLERTQKIQLYKLFFLMLFALFFELAGIGIIIPVMGIITTDNIGVKYPVIKPILTLIGNPTKNLLILYVLSSLSFFYFLKSVFLIYVSWKQAKFSSNIFSNFSNSIYKGYLKMPYNFHINRNSTTLARNLQTEVDLFSTFIQNCLLFITEISAAIGMAFVLLIIEPIGAISVIIFFSIAIFIYSKLTKKNLYNWGKQRQEISNKRNKYIAEGLGSIKEIKLFSGEEFFIQNFNLINQKLRNILIKINTISQIPRFYLEFLGVIGLSIMISVIIFISKSSENIFPIIGIFVAAAFRLIPSVNRIIGSLQTIRYSTPVVDLLYNEIELINKNNLAINNTLTDKIFSFNTEIILSDLSFSFPNRTLLFNSINLKINKGDFIAIIGPSGVGKSTLSDIILGLIKPTSGVVLSDGKDVFNNLKLWQSKIGYVPQNLFLLDDTILNNIAFGIPENKINNTLVTIASENADLLDFINSLPNKFNTIIGERGAKLSGGQRQRIGIARALYSNPEILVFDEATSALDFKTEENIMNSINKLKDKFTIIFITHRLESIKYCTHVYKIEDSKIVLTKPKI